MEHDRDDNDDDSPEGRTGPMRKLKRLGMPEPQATVESSLDRFIEQANEKLVDVSGFKPERKEQILQQEIEQLQRSVAALERDVADANARAEANRRPPWGKMALAFAVGGASMFALGFWLRTVAPATSVEATPPQSQPTTIVTSPIETTKPALDAVALPTSAEGIETPPEPVVEPTKPATKPRPKPSRQRAEASPPSSQTPDAEQAAGSGTGLYNPF